jgi:hypothetical protein
VPKSSGWSAQITPERVLKSSGIRNKSVVRHLGVVLADVKLDQLLELRETVERMQVQPLMT